MKRILCLIIFLLSFSISFFSLTYAQSLPGGDGPEKETGWVFDNGPVKILEEIEYNANKYKSKEVQDTKLNHVTSRACDELWVLSSFTLTRTLCYIKNNISSYLQYFMYIWLTVATIIIIRNWFLLVTSSDREKQMWTFKKNMKYLVIWIILITCIYFILDVFVSIVNFMTE